MLELVYIEWLDSAALHGWQSPDDIRAHAGPVRIQSVGWVLHETDDAITLVAHRYHESEKGSKLSADPMSIPKGVIQERRTLRKR